MKKIIKETSLLFWKIIINKSRFFKRGSM